MNTSTNASESRKEFEQELAPQLDITHFWHGFAKFWWLCVLLALIGAAGMYVRSYLSFVPSYQTAVTFTVQTQSSGANGIGIMSQSFSANRATAAQLSTTFPSIIKSRILQDVVCNDLGIRTFPCTLSASVVKGTNMFTITATGTDPQVTYDVLQSVIRKYPEVAQYVIGNTNLYILTEPVLPTTPANQFAYRTQIVAGALIGFCAGLAWVLVYILLRNTVRSREDIRTHLNQTCLGALPNVEFKRYNKKIDRTITLNNPKVGEGYLESFRALRNSIINAAEGQKVIMVTSAAPGEGKTSVASNLAISLAMMNKQVLIVDADIRNPNVNFRLFDEEEEEDENEAESDAFAYVKNYAVNDTLTLDVLNFNSQKYTLWKIFNVKRLQSLINRLRDSYDYIIIDSSPLGITSEPAVIAQVADAAILVIKQDTVRINRIRSVIDTLLSTNVKILGCILNGVAHGTSHYGYYGYGYNYGYRYAYGYGYGYGKSYSYGDKKRKKRKDKAEKHEKHEKHEKREKKAIRDE